MKALLDEATDPWGVRVERVEVKDVRLPVQLQRAMAAEAEAAREARAKVGNNWDIIAYYHPYSFSLVRHVIIEVTVVSIICMAQTNLQSWCLASK